MAFHLSSSIHTPEVLVDEEKSLFVLRGACFPEDSVEFFQPIREFFAAHIDKLRTTPLEVHIELQYINSSSQRELYRLLYEFLQQNGQIHLYIYQGDDDQELEDLRHVVFGLEQLSGVKITYREGFYHSSVP
jgi:hypothetical protein